MYFPVIGLEIHIQLNTESKIFSSARNRFGDGVNSNISAVDLALPGTLPVMNVSALEKAISFGLAIGGEISKFSFFARKNYFYPDLPKGYQISQLDFPIISGGFVDLGFKKVGVQRAHLEEDAGKSIHDGLFSGIDLNRAGTPLIELVSRPEMYSADEAVSFAKEIYRIVKFLKICDGNMEEGNFRMDANVSLAKRLGSLGTRREIKNLNSFRFLHQAINSEILQQSEILDAGLEVKQSTVLFDSELSVTKLMRVKEDAEDYRYFPDPDLPPMRISDDFVESIRNSMPKIPSPKSLMEMGLSGDEAEFLSTDVDYFRFFESLISEGVKPESAANFISADLRSKLKRDNLKSFQVSPKQIASIIKNQELGVISSIISREILERVWGTDLDVDLIIERDDLKQLSDLDQISRWIDEAIMDSPKAVKEFKSGKEKALNAIAGKVMKMSKAKVNPQELQKILREKLRD